MSEPAIGPDQGARPPVKPPVRVGGFEILEKIGTGGMGLVYKARQISLDRPVALKILPPHLEKDPEFMRRFLLEARATGRLNHPNIVAGIDVGQADGYWYFAMEFVEGESLGRILRQRGRLPEKEAVAIALQIAEGLAHAHAHQLIHRDVKPENILIDRNGTAKLCDLGLARSVRSDHPGMTQDGTTMGTPNYLSPEQARGQKDLDARTDIYSLGATLFHMVAGRPPFAGETAEVVMAKHLSEPAPNLARVAEGVSQGLAAVVARCLEKNPADRYPSMKELIEELRRVQRGQEPETAPPSTAITRRKTHPLPSRPVTVRVLAQARPARSASPLPWILTGLSGAAVLALLVFLSVPRGRESPAGRIPPVPVPPEPDTPLAVREAARVKGAVEPPPPAADPRREHAASEEARLEAVAEQLAEQGDFDGAIAARMNLPPGLEDLLRSRAEQAAAALRARAESRLTQVLEEANRQLAAGEPEKGLRLLDDLKGMKYSAGDSRVAALRSSLVRAATDQARLAQARALQSAKAAFPRRAEVFVAAACSGDLSAALRAAEEARADPALGPLREAVSALGEVAEALQRAENSFREALSALRGRGPRDFETRQGRIRGEVLNVTSTELHLRCEAMVGGVATSYETTVRLADLTPVEIRRYAGDFRPSTPSEHLAAAARALAHRHLEGAEAGLNAAAGHPLEPLLRARLQALRTEAAEAAAREAWESVVRLAGTGKLAPQKAKQILERIEAFEKDHGRTALAASVQAELFALKDRIHAAGGGWKAVPPSGIPVRCKGAADFSVSGNILLIQVPPGTANLATVTLLPHARDFRLRFEYRGDLLEMFLRKVQWQGAVLLMASPQGLVLRTYPTDQPNAPALLAEDRRAGAAAGTWHRVEVSAVGSSLTCSVDGQVLCREARLPAVARGSTHLLVWPGKVFELRNLSLAVLDRQTTAGTSEGIVTGKGTDWIEFKEDGEDVPLRYEAGADPSGHPDPRLLQAIQTTVTLNRARLAWGIDRDRLVLTGLEVLKPVQKAGAMVGTITFKQGTCIEIQPLGGGPPERLIPRWVGGLPAQGGGPEPKIVAELARYGVGDRVKVDWIYDDRKRLTGIEPAK